MKAQLVGIQNVAFTDESSGELISGNKLHCVGIEKEKTKGFIGIRVATVWVKDDMPINHLKVGGNIQLNYEMVLGSKKPVLVSIENCQ